MSEPLDPLELLRTLARHGVDHTIIGGVAVLAHGHRRTTRDLDVIPEPSPANLRRLAGALAELGARPADLPGAPCPTVEQLAAAAVVPPLATAHGELHLLNRVPGAPPYAELRERALAVELEGIRLLIAGRDDLIAMKRAAGRPHDLEDIAILAVEDG